MLFQVDVVRDSLYDLNEFVSLRAPLVRSEVVPDLEIQLLSKKMLNTTDVQWTKWAIHVTLEKIN